MKDKTILIVDDDEKIVRMLIRRLKKIGVTIHTAPNGKIGIEKAWDLMPDLILMDIQMPVMDGYTMVKTLRANGYKKLVVACTASVRAKDTQETIAAGCDYFIAKPVGLDFESKIIELLSSVQ